jgi:hypothetical protein
MDFSLTPAQLDIRKEAREFAKGKVEWVNVTKKGGKKRKKKRRWEVSNFVNIVTHPNLPLN